jgi:CelD/BcsL family acetyltransferase involved in cellulose biosynthesis
MPQWQSEVVTEFSKLEALADDWNRLWAMNPRGEIFDTFAWARASWRTFNDERALCTPVVYEGDQVVGILPLARKGRVLRFLGDPRSDYNDLLCAPDTGDRVFSEAVRALADLAVSWQIGELRNVSENSIIAATLPQAAASIPISMRLSPGSVCPRVDLSSPDVLDAILRKKSLRRHENKLSRLGELRFRHLEDRDEIKRHLPSFFRQHIARRALAGDRSVLCDTAVRSFYEALVEEFNPQTQLRFSVLEWNERPVAYHFGFEANGKFVWYKPTFDIDVARYSPGEVLLRKLFEYAGERNLQEFDFTVGNESFKSRFANRVPRNHTLYLCPQGLRGRAAAIGVRLKDSLKKHPRLVRAAKSVRRVLHRYRGRLEQALHSNRPAMQIGRLVRASLPKFLKRERIPNTEILPQVRHQFAERASQESQATITDVGLLELACLSLEYPHWLSPKALLEAQTRLSRGERLSLIRQGATAPELVWTEATDAGDTLPNADPELLIPADRPSGVLYEPRNSKPVSPKAPR